MKVSVLIASLGPGGEVAAVVDELADQGEQAADAAWWGLWAGGGRRIGHEQNRNIDRRPRQGIIVSGSPFAVLGAEIDVNGMDYRAPTRRSFRITAYSPG
jgi:hypothetical protein